MKTTLYLLFSLIVIFSSGWSVSAPDISQPSMESLNHSAYVPDNWTLVHHDCELVSTHCCCSDGNGYFYLLPGMYFTCAWGGAFECSSDLGDCIENPSNCDNACPGGGCRA